MERKAEELKSWRAERPRVGHYLCGLVSEKASATVGDKTRPTRRGIEREIFGGE
jgi:hypothetical protein